MESVAQEVSFDACMDTHFADIGRRGKNEKKRKITNPFLVTYMRHEKTTNTGLFLVRHCMTTSARLRMAPWHSCNTPLTKKLEVSRLLR